MEYLPPDDRPKNVDMDETGMPLFNCPPTAIDVTPSGGVKFCN
jgi:hypothetical protein